MPYVYPEHLLKYKLLMMSHIAIAVIKHKKIISLPAKALPPLIAVS